MDAFDFSELEGATIHGRSYSAAYIRPGPWFPKTPAWIEHEYASRCYAHPLFPRHLVCIDPNGNSMALRMGHRTKELERLRQFAQFAFGQDPALLPFASYPLSLRLPLRSDGACALAVPHNCRCRRVWPTEEPEIVRVNGVPIELRISASRGSGEARFCAEAFVGRAHVTKDGDPRSFLYLADARHVLTMNVDNMKKFTAVVLEKLFFFGIQAERFGLAIDNERRLADPIVARAREESGDILFDTRLILPTGVERFVSSSFLPRAYREDEREMRLRAA